LQLPTQRRVRRHAGQAEPLGQGLDVEHRPALDDWRAAAPEDVFDRRSRAQDVLGRVERRGRVDEVDHVIRHSEAIFGWRLVGRYVEHPIDLA